MDIRQEASRGLADIESFLFRQAHLRAARRRVGAFTAEESGLTAEQKEDIERWYVEEQIYVARMVTRHIADKVNAVKEQQHRRFGRWLRGILVTMTLITAAMAVFVTAILTAHG
ncbi:hypothetical protein NMG29_31750 [Streptomyces cocklensis]|jgi:hypothetical protein|uniref:Uncharacterized protein n=1 Tax=Actinacidiphila cocklensis TaxID=887465 RepID=A0A9W4DQA0_9ACTN|nr:hypothetical protein [Actinacidiphila cocklensis]MDD1062718.1 hypothetical protein [Actinacidiphila cocklensis]WSX75409.1 hypothetical protein OH826_16795 [Streptomyces sp. NBC_00899]CAG6392048.1 conserved hypothetical protein [Actinacidiphila cocklensis]